MTDICLEEARKTTGEILDGNYCNGRQCENYQTCIARIKFDAMTKRAPTDYEIAEAITRDRKFCEKRGRD
jgi:hypothetical protein